jgi:hypothetical protein
MDGALLRLLVLARGGVVGLGRGADGREGRAAVGSSARCGGRTGCVDHSGARVDRRGARDFGLHETQFDILLIGVFVFVVFVFFVFIVAAVVHLLLRLLLLLLLML